MAIYSVPLGNHNFLQCFHQVFLAQMNSFNETTSNDSLPGQFMKWADQKMTFLDPHIKCATTLLKRI